MKFAGEIRRDAPPAAAQPGAVADGAGQDIGLIVARRGMAPDNGLHQHPDHHQQANTSYRYGEMIQHGQLAIPANPMKAIDMIPANMSVTAAPWTIDETLARSSRSRRPAINTSAMVKPTPAPSA